jgi:SAM-dependent methyltransferase
MRELSEAACRQGELFGLGARDWADEQERMALPVWQAALEAANVQRGTRLLDAGCGSGGASMLAAELGAEVFGVDPSVNMLTIARERLPAADFRIGEIENLPFPNAQFDAVIAINSLQFTTNPKLGAHELGRVCREGGRVVIAVPGPLERTDGRVIFEAMAKLFAKPPSPGPGVFALSPPGVLESVVESVEDIRVEGIHSIEAVMTHADMDHALRGALASGPSQRAIEIHGREKVADAVRDALQPFVQPDGSVRLRNTFRYAVAVKIR